MSRKLQGFKIRRKMNVFKGVCRLGQGAALPHRMRQHIRKLLDAGIQSLPYRLHHDALAESRRHTVNRDNPPGDSFLPIAFLCNRIHHTAARAVCLDFSEENIALPLAQIVFGIGLIKIGDIQHTAVIHRPKLHKLKAAAYPRQPRRVCHHRLHAYALTVAGQGDGFYCAAILIFPGEKRNKVKQRKDAELIERLRLFLSYALDKAYICIQVCHASLHKSKRVAGIGQRKLLNQALGTDDLVIVVYQYHIKAVVLCAVLAPVVESLALPQHKHSGGKAVC